jgi:ribosome biogenesis GTPase
MVNLLVPQAQSRVGELSQALQAGRHTTTHTLWHWLDPSRHGALIDSPGFQEFGLQQIGAAELAHHMADFRPLLGQCRFSNCQHRQEPDCAITAAVAQGAVSATRYRIYLEILDELQTRRW